MDEVMKLSSKEFEKLVVSLLLHMGYGNGITEAGMVTQQSNDGGIEEIAVHSLYFVNMLYRHTNIMLNH